MLIEAGSPSKNPDKLSKVGTYLEWGALGGVWYPQRTPACYRQFPPGRGRLVWAVGGHHPTDGDTHHTQIPRRIRVQNPRQVSFKALAHTISLIKAFCLRRQIQIQSLSRSGRCPISDDQYQMKTGQDKIQILITLFILHTGRENEYNSHRDVFRIWKQVCISTELLIGINFEISPTDKKSAWKRYLRIVFRSSHHGPTGICKCK